jgi:uncharacterized membrane protein
MNRKIRFNLTYFLIAFLLLLLIENYLLSRNVVAIGGVHADPDRTDHQ